MRFWGCVVFGLGLLVWAARADERKAPEFVPFVVDAAQDRAIREYLDGLPFKQAAPLVVWLNELEGRARARWEADNAPKAEEPAK